MSINTEQLAKLVKDATEEVFSTMLGTEITSGEPYLGGSDPGPSEGVVSLIGMAGAWIGTGSVFCSAEMACKIAAGFLMTEYPAVNSEVLDAVAEVTNMIIGNVKTSLEEQFGPMGLSIPTVIYGRNFMTRTVGNSEWVGVPFFWNNERIEVQVCLAPNEDGKTAHSRFWMAGMRSI